MGLTHVAVQLRSAGSKRTYNADFLVDTGAFDSLAPASLLREIGVEPVGKRTYELANGKLQEYEFGLAELTFLDEIVATRIIFGPDDAEPLLGVVALESAGFLVDPNSQTLRKPRAFPLKMAVSAK